MYIQCNVNKMFCIVQLAMTSEVNPRRIMASTDKLLKIDTALNLDCDLTFDTG